MLTDKKVRAHIMEREKILCRPMNGDDIAELRREQEAALQGRAKRLIDEVKEIGPPPTLEHLVTVQEIAKQLGVVPSSLTRRARRSMIPVSYAWIGGRRVACLSVNHAKTIIQSYLYGKCES